MEEEWLILLPYFKNIAYDDMPELVSNFEHYDLFRIRTWMQRYVNDIIRDQVDINYVTTERDGRMQYVMEIMKGKDRYPLYLEQVQSIKSYLNEIINREDVLMDLSVLNLPKYWIDWMIPFVITKIEPKLQPSVQDLGISVILDRYGFIDNFNSLFLEIDNLLQSMYSEGYIIDAEKIADNWKLERIWNNIYKPTWRDNRFAPIMVDFLMRLLSGDNRIYIFIKPSYVLRYKINEVIDNAVFYDFKMSFTADSVDEAMEKIDKIESLSANSDGTIEFGKGITYIFEGKMITSLLK